MDGNPHLTPHLCRATRKLERGIRALCRGDFHVASATCFGDGSTARDRGPTADVDELDDNLPDTWHLSTSSSGAAPTRDTDMAYESPGISLGEQEGSGANQPLPSGATQHPFVDEHELEQQIR